MTRSRGIRWIAGILARLAASMLVLLAGQSAALAYPDPPIVRPTADLPLPPRVYTIVAGGMPGWQITLISLGTAVLAAAVAVAVNRRLTARRRRRAEAVNSGFPPSADHAGRQHDRTCQRAQEPS